MAGEPASRVRGLSEARFRAACGTEARCRAGRWSRRRAGPRASSARSAAVARGPGPAQHPPQDPVPGLPAPGLARRRHHLPRHRAAARHLVPGDVAERDRRERHQLGRARAHSSVVAARRRPLPGGSGAGSATRRGADPGRSRARFRPPVTGSRTVEAVETPQQAKAQLRRKNKVPCGVFLPRFNDDAGAAIENRPAPPAVVRGRRDLELPAT
jgi:hypothetical protein